MCVNFHFGTTSLLPNACSDCLLGLAVRCLNTSVSFVLAGAVVELKNRDKAQRGQELDTSALDSADRSEVK